MKKIISVILTLTILLSMSSFTVFASSGELTITTPADGTTIENADTDIVVSGAGADSEMVYEFDGKAIDNTKLTKDMLTIGEHTLKVYEIAEDGSVNDAESKFNVIKQVDVTKLSKNFNDMASGYVADASTIVLSGNASLSKADHRITIATRYGSNTYYGRVSAVSGPESGSDAAPNITSEEGSTRGATSLPSINVQLASGITTVGSFEFDLKINPSTYIIFSAIGASTSFLKNDNTLRLFDNYSVASDGKILGSSENTYDASKWQHVKIILEPTSTCTKFKLEMSEKDAQGNWVVHTTVTDSTTNSIGDRVDGFRMYYGGGAGMGLTFDNVKVSEAPAYTGIKNIEYMYDTELNSDANPDSSRLTGLKIYMNEPVIAAVPVTVTDKSGNTITISDTTKDTSSNAIVATLPSAQKLTANTEYNVLVSLAANFAGLSDLATKSFKTKADSYAAEEPQFKVGTTTLIKKTQLCGNVLTVDLPIANADTPKPAAFVLAVRDGNKLVGLGIVIPDGGVPVGGATYTLQTGTLPADMTDVTIQIMYLNNINNISTAFATVTKTLN